MTEEARKTAKAMHQKECEDCVFNPTKLGCRWRKKGMYCDTDLHSAADLIESLSAQLEQTKNKLSELLYYATGGGYSKADHSIDDMRRFVYNYNQSVCNELEQVEKERDGLNIMLAQAQSMLETRTKERDAAVEEMKIIRSCRQCKTWQEYFKDNGDVSPCEDCDMYSNWQWRGVEVEG